MTTRRPRFAPFVFLSLAAACSSGSTPSVDAGTDGPQVIVEGACETGDAGVPDFLRRLGCLRDFQTLASEPLDTSIPGARSVKVVLDRQDGNALYFQNSVKYKIHHDFVADHLSGNGKPVVAPLSQFNQSEYFLPSRRFILGAVTYYEQPKVWTLELAPYDTASAEMIKLLFDTVKAAAYLGPAMTFHPTSDLVSDTVKDSTGLPMTTSDQLYAGIDYQPLNLGSVIGRLRFVKAAALEDSSTYLSYRDIVVLDTVPNDISVVLGIITEEFQTPLSHVNVLSQNRKTPNMGLRHATTNPKLTALDGKWVKLTVNATDWSIEEATAAESDAFWETHKPTPVVLPAVDLTVTDLRNIEDVTPETTGTLRENLKKAVAAFGGKAAHYSILAKTKDVPVPKAFAIPVYYYMQFMQENGLFAKVDALLADSDFQSKPEVRDAKLKEFRTLMKAAPMNQAFLDALKAKLAADYPGQTMRFRTSTNSEDLDGFPCAGCYESHTGDPANWDTVPSAIRKAFSSIWLFRTFEERAYNGIDHKTVMMALLVHHNFPDEEANGVALTANPYDSSGLQPGLYVNVQFGGDAEVVHPPAGVTSDQFIYQFNQPGQPVSYLSHSSLIPTGQTVLDALQIHELGIALDAIHNRFSPAYGPQAGNQGWYAMDVEFKFDGPPGEKPKLAVKQARPHPGRGQ